MSLFDPITNFIKSQIELFHSAATQFVEIVSVVVFSFVQHDSSWFGTQMKRPFFFPRMYDKYRVNWWRSSFRVLKLWRLPQI